MPSRFDASGSGDSPRSSLSSSPRGRGGWLAIPKAGVLVTPASWLLLGSLGSTDVAQLVGGPSRLRLVLAYVRRSRAHDPTDVHRINQQGMVVITRRTRHVPVVEWSDVDQVQGMSGPIGGIAQISYREVGRHLSRVAKRGCMATIVESRCMRVETSRATGSWTEPIHLLTTNLLPARSGSPDQSWLSTLPMHKQVLRPAVYGRTGRQSTLTRLDPSVSAELTPGSHAWFRRRVPAPQRALARDVSRAPLARRGECRSPPGGRLPQPGPR